MSAFSARDLVTANGNLKAICRMARIWRDYYDVPMRMLIDTLAFQFVADWPHRDNSYLYHDWLFRDFVKYLLETDASQQYWRAPGSGAYVYKKGPFRGQASTAYQAALSAIAHEANERPCTARNKWREIFRSSTPEGEMNALEGQVASASLALSIHTKRTRSRVTFARACCAELKWAQIVLAALTTSGTLAGIFTDQLWLKLVTALVSLITLIVSGYMKGFIRAQWRRSIAIRRRTFGPSESYLSLLTDIATGAIKDDVARERRDNLQAALAAIYKLLPGTTPKAYGLAQKGLQAHEDYTLNPGEIDKFLPPSLKRDE